MREAGALCPDCWPGLSFIAPPYCACCGYPFPYDPGAGTRCGECLRGTPPFERARAVLRYDDASRDLVISLKHGDRTDAAPSFGQWMARAATDVLAGADLVAPVPLHRTRLIARRFNQSALLAHAIGREAGVRVIPDLLLRTRATPSQGALSASQRRRNVQGAFAAHPGRAETLPGRRVTLVDDVYTTGATAGACTRALMRAGAAAVDVVTLARVVRPAG